MQRSGMLCIVPAPLTHKHSSGPNERSFTDKSECFNFVFVLFFFPPSSGLVLALASPFAVRKSVWARMIAFNFQIWRLPNETRSLLSFEYMRFGRSHSGDIQRKSRRTHVLIFFFVVHHILRRRIHQSNDNASQQQQATKAKLNDLNF